MAVGFTLNGGLDVVAEFTVWGDPMSKQRPRTSRGRTYTPKATIEAESRVAWSFRAATVGYSYPAVAEYGMAVRFVRANRRHKDTDNMLKLLFDALNRVAYADDSQIVEHAVERTVGTASTARTDVVLYRV